MAVLQIRQKDGQIMDLASAAATFIDVVYAGTSGGSVAYPALAGMTLLVTRSRLDGTQWQGLASWSVDYSAGYPILSWTAGSSSAQFVVLAR